MGVFGTDDDVHAFSLAEGSFYPRFLSLRRHRKKEIGQQGHKAKEISM